MLWSFSAVNAHYFRHLLTAHFRKADGCNIFEKRRLPRGGRKGLFPPRFTLQPFLPHLLNFLLQDEDFLEVATEGSSAWEIFANKEGILFGCFIEVFFKIIYRGIDRFSVLVPLGRQRFMSAFHLLLSMMKTDIGVLKRLSLEEELKPEMENWGERKPLPL